MEFNHVLHSEPVSDSVFFGVSVNYKFITQMLIVVWPNCFRVTFLLLKREYRYPLHQQYENKALWNGESTNCWCAISSECRPKFAEAICVDNWMLQQWREAVLHSKQVDCWKRFTVHVLQLVLWAFSTVKSRRESDKSASMMRRIDAALGAL